MHIRRRMTAIRRLTRQPAHPRVHRRLGRGLPLAAALALASACAGGGVTAPAPMPPEPDPEARGVPGFDTRDYPGDGVMRTWLAESPYRWVGFYLPAPCYTGTTWQGKRSTIRDMGWGTAVLFVGEQDWPSTTSAARSSSTARATDTTDAVEAAEARCTRRNLSAERGRVDGAAAADVAGAEGFPSGTVVYLDVEPVDSVSDSLAAYVRAWTRGLAARGFAPGLYAHARNAEALMEVMTRALEGDSPAPRLWVASTGGFNLRRGPTESGFDAAIWQGVLDTHETYGGTTLQIDRNVADRRDPSG